mgnify:CR=1 FL=1
MARTVRLAALILLSFSHAISSSAQTPETAAGCNLSLDPQPIRVSPLFDRATRVRLDETPLQDEELEDGVLMVEVQRRGLLEAPDE